jgi:uncharacterized protein
MCNNSEGITRRQTLQTMAALAAALGASMPLGWARAADEKRRKVLFFTKSSGFQHSCIKREKADQLSHAERVLVDLGKQHGFDVTATKDGSVFTPEGLAPFDLIAFYTTGDLDKSGTDGTTPMPPGGKEALLKFIESGRGFVGFHCATDTFDHHGDGADSDPYIKMIGGEFETHKSQQPAKIRAVHGNGTSSRTSPPTCT